MLFDQLVALVLAEGFARLTLDDLAARLHCSKSTLYTLAASKEQLVRRAAVHFFASAAERVEAAVDAESDATGRVDAYLRAVSDELRPVSDTFFIDLAATRSVAEIYERNTRIAARRVSELIAAGVAAGEFRPVSADFVADVVASTMVRIQQRTVATATGLDDAAAYGALADLVLHGLET